MADQSDQEQLPFGPHLMLEAYNCPSEVLDDANLVYKILDELPNKIGMHKLTLPYIVHTEGNGQKDPGGWSGFVIIQESHISIHTFTKRRFATIDVYSCKNLDVTEAITYFKQMLKTEDVEYHVEMRGKRYPQENID